MYFDTLALFLFRKDDANNIPAHQFTRQSVTQSVMK